MGGSPCQQATRLFRPYILDYNGDTTSLLMRVACSMSLDRGDTHLKAVSGHAGKANDFVVDRIYVEGPLGQPTTEQPYVVGTSFGIGKGTDLCSQ